MTSVVSTVGKGMLIMTISGVVLKLFSFATIFLVLHKLSLYEYGVLELGIAATGFFSIFQLPGFVDTVSSDVVYEKSQQRITGAKSIFKGYVYLQTILSICAALLIIAVSSAVAEYVQSPITGIMTVLGGTLVLLPARTFVTLLATVRLDYVTQAWYSLWEEGVKFIILLTLFMFAPFSVLLVPLSILVAQCMILPFFTYQSWKQYKLFFVDSDDVFSVPALRTAVGVLQKHGKWSIFVTYMTNFGQNIRVWIIKFLLGTDVVALYAVAHGLINHVTSLLPINRVMMPVIAQFISDRARSAKIFMKTIKYQLAAYVVLGVGSLFILPILFTYAFPQYLNSLELFSWMLLTLIPLGFGGTLTSFFIAMRQQFSLFYISFARLLVIVVTLPVAVYFFGLYGIVIEMFITATWFAVSRYQHLRSWSPDFKLHVKDLVTIDTFDRMILQKILHRFSFKNK